MKKAVLKNFAVFTGKLHISNFIKKRLQHRCSPLNIAKIFKNTYFEEHLRTAGSKFFSNFIRNVVQVNLFNPSRATVSLYIP